MLWGRCNLLSTTRYLSELSRKQYSRNRRKSNALTESASLAFVPAQLRYRSTDNARDLVSLSKRMSSSSSSSSQGHQMGQKEAKMMAKNRLASEKSPYLLQHAGNPVQWYPWGDEALERARAEDKMIFLSVGYSTCHWCHVMERESFENPEIADIMNKNFINIKVDREERPDIDRIYMTFIQSITGHGGWPMSVFLAPDLTPITGGTYFPPENKHGYPGFKTILLGISREWQENKNEIMQHGRAIIEKLRNVAEKQEKKEQSVPTEECATTCVRLLSRSYEPQFGGFSGAPKFPQPVNFNLLFHVYARDPNSEMGQKSLDMCVYTLRKMAAGGIHDHVGQGFARYSVDDEWHVPHFEKMLYDQGQLMQSYADAFLATKDPFFAEIVDDIATYVTRDLRHKEGGFYSAEDADSFPTEESREKKEGAFYVWSYNEIQELLSRELPDAKNTKLVDIFSFHFSVEVNGNVPPHRDPHGELTKKNVLIEYGSLEETAEHFGLTVERTKSLLKEAKEILFEARKKRPRPHLDDKIVTAWNGLMISGLSKAGAATGNERYTELATDAARFVERYLYDEMQHLLLRSCYRDEDDTITQLSVPIRGYHTDYAFLVKGLLDLYEAGLDPHWLQLAETLQDVQDQLFWDSTNGAYFSTTKDDPTVILRLKDDHDGAEPCGNSIACSNLLRLGSFLNRESFKDKAEKLLAYFAGTLTRMPAALPEMVSSLLHYRDSSTQIYVVGKTDAEDTKELLRVVNERLVPGKVLIFADHERSNNALLRKNKVLARMKQQNGRATAYVCRYHTCSLPVTSPSDLANLLSNDR